MQSTSLTPIETSLINNCDDIGFLLCSIPQNRIRSLPSTLTDLSYEDATSFFADDLPSSSLVPTEVWRWRQKWCQVDAAEHPTTLYTALQACDRDFSPNIYVFLRIACTIPVTACENERANSVLKNLKTFLRNIMGQERLSSCTFITVYQLILMML